MRSPMHFPIQHRIPQAQAGLSVTLVDEPLSNQESATPGELSLANLVDEFREGPSERHNAVA
jgi:hypothetical protein